MTSIKISKAKMCGPNGDIIPMAALVEYRFTFGTDKLNLQSYFIKARNFFEAVTEFKAMLYENKIPIDSIEDVEVTEIRR